MKQLMILFTLLLSLAARADLEHREGQGSKPSEKSIEASRACFQEIIDQGCGHPIEDRELFNNCLADKITSLSSGCQTFFGKLYGKKK